MSITKEALGKYTYNTLFIETGTNQGRCVGIALNLGFEEIYSIEIDEELFEKAMQKYRSFCNVIIYQGDSGEVLEYILSLLKEPATIYLDAHKSNENTQIWKELEAVKKHYIKGTVILIDDLNVLFDEKSKEKLKRALLDIDAGFKIYEIDGICANRNTKIVNDILVAE